MALKLYTPFPIFAPPVPVQNPCPCLYPTPSNPRPPTEIRFSRWNNANAERFNQRQRAQQEIEDDIRRLRRFESATRIAQIYDSDTTGKEPETFKSRGTPSIPSAPSIPGRKSKYSKPPDHPAFRRLAKVKNPPQVPKKPPIDSKASLKISEDGVSYVIDGAPFEFKYSYTETPKVKPLKLREPPFAPFGPTTMGRPWTGRAPLPPSKKKLKEFDSFELPPPNKKGVKPVQKPGPFLPGTGPRYVSTREEILGEPLTDQEVRDLVNSCIRSRRQLNMGRDGLTHNMLDNIHAHWKRRRVCKIKCKGVCTVDMDTVCQQLEDKTGGKIIFRRGGVLFLFRGRNYNHKTRPRFPLMLWKPVTPVYPRLIQKAPECLTLEEATEMRRKGRQLIPICKLAKNGLYSDLVKNIREAFEVCELVRINCQGIKGSDYKKIGGKLKDLIPCVLISFENEHILMWRGLNWKSSIPNPEKGDKNAKDSEIHGAITTTPPSGAYRVSISDNRMWSAENRTSDTLSSSMSPVSFTDELVEQVDSPSSIDGLFEGTEGVLVESQTNDRTSEMGSSRDDVSQSAGNITENEGMSDVADLSDESESIDNLHVGEAMLNKGHHVDAGPTAASVQSDTMVSLEATENKSEPFIKNPIDQHQPQHPSDSMQIQTEPARADAPCMERVKLLMKQAVEIGHALVLDDASLDADRVYERAVAFAKSAPGGRVFRHYSRNSQLQDSEKRQEYENSQMKEDESVAKKRGRERQTSKVKRRNSLDENFLDVAPQGSLRIDELAKLLA